MKEGPLCHFWNKNSFLCVIPYIMYFNFWLIILVMSGWKMDLSRNFHYIRLKNHFSWLLWATACSKPLYLISHCALCGYAVSLLSGPFPWPMTNLTLRVRLGPCACNNPQALGNDLFKNFSLPEAICSLKCQIVHMCSVVMRYNYGIHTHIHMHTHTEGGGGNHRGGIVFLNAMMAYS